MQRWRIGLFAPKYFRFYAYEVLEGMVAYASSHPELQFIDLRFAKLKEGRGKLAGLNTDGLLLGLDHAEYDKVGKHLPRNAVLVNLHPDLLEDSIPSVCIDPQGLARKTLRYFSSLAYPNVASLGAMATVAHRKLNVLLAEEAREVNLSFHSFSVSFAPGVFDGSENSRTDQDITAWIDGLPKPVGILCSGGYSALAVCRCAARAGYTIPDEVGILSRSDDAACLFADPPITSFRSAGMEIGKTAIRIMHETLLGASLPQGQVSLPVPEIIERRSTGIPLVADSATRQALHFIRRHALEGITVDDVVQHVPSISRSHLYHSIRRLFQCTPAQKITGIRLDHAKQLLQQSDMSISQISETCGYSCQPAFSAVFRRETGMPPSAWRESRKSPSP